MKTVRGVFTSLDAAERACRQLAKQGFTQGQLSLDFDEACLACALEQERLFQGPAGTMPLGQGLGALFGVGVGIMAVFWPINGEAATDPTALSLFDWMLRLFIIASWSTSGAILGGMLAAVGVETWQTFSRRSEPKPEHSHYVLSVEPSLGTEAVVREIIERRGGRLVEAPAVLHYPD